MSATTFRRTFVSHLCILSAVSSGCSGERPSFPDTDAQSGVFTGALNPDAGADGSVSATSEVTAETSGSSTRGTNTSSTRGTTDAGTGPDRDDTSDTDVHQEPNDASTNGEPDVSVSDPTDDATEPDRTNSDATDTDPTDDSNHDTDDDANDASSVTLSDDGASTSDDNTEPSDPGDAGTPGTATSSTGTSSTGTSSTATSGTSTATSTGTSSTNTSTSTATCVPSVRDCNSAADNDCDGQPDNTLDDVCRCEPGTEQACDTHPGLDGVGLCRSGTQACVALGSGGSDWEDCSGSVGPQTEVCTGNLDEDCDGEVNESETCPCADDPCENGGSCEPDGDTYTCDCSGTEFAGDNCDESLITVLPAFSNNAACRARAVSRDGSVVGATCNDRPVYWTQAGGWRSLTAPAGYLTGNLVDMSANGQVFVASMDSTSSLPGAAVRWSSGNVTGTVLAGGSGDSFVTGTSGDGQRTLGYSTGTGLLVWSGNAAATAYTTPADAIEQYSVISDQSNTVWSSNEEGTQFFRWTGANARTTVPSGESVVLNVTGVSEDGQVVVGYGWPSSVVAVWRFANNQLTWLNSAGVILCFSYGHISADGSRVAGWCQSPVVWIGEDQLNIHTYLAPVMDQLTDTSIVQSTTAMRSMSADGRYAIGDDFTRVFRVRLPN